MSRIIDMDMAPEGEIICHGHDGILHRLVGPDFWQAMELKKNSAWNGEGHPPVGTTCEWHPSVHGWIEVAILGRDGEDTWYRAKGESRTETCRNMAFFRPIRTPEQIAAEVREKSIQQMIDDTNILTGIMSDRKIMAGQLYDAGYRKFEIVENEE